MGCIFSKNKDEDDVVYDMTPIRNLPVIFVNGVPGAGNQTVSQTISNMTGYAMIRPGELVRAEALKDTTRGRLISAKLNAQEDVPEQIIVDLIKEAMLMQQEAKGFILVGFPKNPRMSNMFNKQVKWPEKVVALEVDDEVAATRLQKKLSELGRPEAEINAARRLVRDAAHDVKKVQKRFGGHVITLLYENEPARPVKYHTLTEYRREVAAYFQFARVPVAQYARYHPTSTSPSPSSSISQFPSPSNILFLPKRPATHCGGDQIWMRSGDNYRIRTPGSVGAQQRWNWKQVDSNGNSRTLALTLKEILSDTIDKGQRENEPQGSSDTELSQSLPRVAQPIEINDKQ
ncbi:Adenylate kinase isoenzyme 1 [Eumeta japonica]|uniref:Adenylate kinase isoenzyme 1 n=1 Tax=Eumeta variegata TaxID=151549 RepID=A0A4C1ZVV3_EUMVA|nr:Adenylate kinase isoenzyme 1 [Eumeta japonica]